MLLVQPTVDNAKRYSKQRISPMVLECPRLTEKIADNKSRESGNNMLEKEFPGGILLLGGANSAAGLRSTPVRYLMADEISNWPHDVDGEGDPLGLATERTNTFARRKIYKCSTPGIRGVCRIEAEYLNSDQRKYHVPCPQCGELHELTWQNFKIPKDDTGRYRPKKAHMVCPVNGCIIEEHHKTAMLRDAHDGGTARWVATNPDWHDATKRGYHISALYSPIGWKSWAKIAQQWIDSQGNPQRLKAFINNVLAQTWEEVGDRVNPHSLMERAEDYSTNPLPAEVLVLTAGGDVQPDRLEVELIGKGIGPGGGEQTWSLEHKVIMGDPNQPLVWQLLDLYLATEYKHPVGVTLKVARTFIDTAGANTKAVYAYVGAREHMSIYGIKGRGGDGVPPVGPPTKNNLDKIPLVPIGTFALKDTIYGSLKIDDPGPGYVHFRKSYDAGYYQQLTSEEVRVKHNSKGFPVREYFKIHPRNEVLDCLVYALAAFMSLGVDLDQLAKIFSGTYEANDNVRRVRGEIETAA
jgi:phage terminase large subunit GpA-like protein